MTPCCYSFVLAVALAGHVLAQDLLLPEGRADRPAGAAEVPITLIEYSLADLWALRDLSSRRGAHHQG